MEDNIMKHFDLNKHSSDLRQRLRNVLRKHECAYSFKRSKAYLQTLKTTLESLQQQEAQFADFVIQKQKEIDVMESGIFKSKMQEHLDKIAAQTYDHFCKLTDKYQWMLKSEEKDTSLPYAYTKLKK